MNWIKNGTKSIVKRAGQLVEQTVEQSLYKRKAEYEPRTTGHLEQEELPGAA